MAESTTASTKTGPVTDAASTGPFQVKLMNLASFPHPPTRYEITLPQTSTVKDLVDKVYEFTKYTNNMYKLTYKMDTLIPADDLEATLNTWLMPGTCLITIDRSPHFDGKSDLFAPPATLPLRSLETLGRPAASDYPVQPASQTPNPAPHPTLVDWKMKSKTGFVGLSNQGATCYLNSLIQTLFMTPEFRDAVYKWSFDDWAKKKFEEKLADKQLEENENETKPKSTEERFNKWVEEAEKNSIPRQLQKLFLRLQLCDDRSESTQGLTSSFGWTAKESFTQHDVQELCRLLFEALESVWKGTEQEKVIEQLYQGKMKDYVQCLNCRAESFRTDNYLDIPLVIRGFGQTKAVSSIEEALYNFTESEILNGANQYSCTKCGSPQDAKKGLQFVTFPYVLTLQLKRFDYDFTTDRRIKLNDRVTFPEILDVNQFLQDQFHGSKEYSKATGKDHEEEEKIESKVETTVEPKGKNVAAEEDSEGGDSADSEEKQIHKGQRQEEIQQALKNGPLVYELFSILIHRGSAMGGHYYGYIRSFATGDWYCFNDSSVTFISTAQLEEAYGEIKPSKYGAGTNAYMLSYRQYDPARNMVEQSKEDLSEAFKQMVEREKQQREDKEKAKEAKLEMVSLKITYEETVFDYEFHKSDTLQKVVNESSKFFKLEEYLKDDCLRVRELAFDLPEKPHDSTVFSESLEALNWKFSRNIQLEIKDKEATWPPYDPNHLRVKLFIFQPDTNNWSKMHVFSFDRETRLKDFKIQIEEKFGIPSTDQIITKEDILEDYREWSDDATLPRHVGIYDTAKVWVEPKQGQTGTRAGAEITRLKNILEVTYNLPGTTVYDQKYTSSKQQTLLSLKEALSKIIGLSTDEFKIFKTHGVPELRNENETLGTLFLSSPKITLEKGRPLKSGEINIKYLSFDPNAVGKQIHDLFELPLPETMTVKEAKKYLVENFSTLYKQNHWSISPNPENIRLRDLVGSSPKRIFLDTETVKQLGKGYIYNVPEIAIQNLPEGTTEEKTNTDTLVFFLQQFHPDTWTLGPRFEFYTNDDELQIELSERIIKHTGIEQIGLTPCENWLGPKILTFGNLNWKCPPRMPSEADTLQNVYPGKVRALGLFEGDVLIFRDMSVPLAELTDDEKKQKKIEDQKRRIASSNSRSHFTSANESKLVIHEKDVEL